ncbi:MAG TPA: serine/threonine-protein kinase [Anaerolineales bacterium]|nr:serine/threonine-protein kinase [Anaerolineales bacterium]
MADRVIRPYAIADLKRGRKVGGHQILEVYPEGRGGMARVVRAMLSGNSGQDIALKISRMGPNQDYFFAAIQKEVETLQKLDSPGVVALRAISEGKNQYKERAVEIIGNPWFFGMECLRGGSLESFIREIGPLSLSEAAAICRLVGAGLEHVHSRGFAHNDVKPDNVLFRRQLVVGDRFEPVLIDFGVAAKLVRHQLDGSVVYMAPERLQESREPSAPELAEGVDPTKADVWSMGILLYRMLAGREPFLGLTDRSITSAIMRAIPPPITSKRKDLPRELDEFIIEGCLAKDPRLRASMAQFDRVIGRYTQDFRVTRVPRRRRRFLVWRLGA